MEKVWFVLGVCFPLINSMARANDCMYLRSRQAREDTSVIITVLDQTSTGGIVGFHLLASAVVQNRAIAVIAGHLLANSMQRRTKLVKRT